jgi:hypothetical protein
MGSEDLRKESVVEGLEGVMVSPVGAERQGLLQPNIFVNRGSRVRVPSGDWS